MAIPLVLFFAIDIRLHLFFLLDFDLLINLFFLLRRTVGFLLQLLFLLLDEFDKKLSHIIVGKCIEYL